MGYFDETTEKSHNIDYVIQFMRNVENPEWMIDLIKNMCDENKQLKLLIGGDGMKRIAKFEKVDKNTFVINVTQTIGKSLVNGSEIFGQALRGIVMESVDTAHQILSGIWDDIVDIPKRKTMGSAGYDFVCPFDVCLLPGQEVVIPTGIKCRMDNGWVLKVYPRSGLGFKYRCRFANTVGIIDGDYYNNEDNEGHILIDIVNEGNKKMELRPGDRFAQGIFVEFGITTDDNADGSRVGGVGSTGR